MITKKEATERLILKLNSPLLVKSDGDASETCHLVMKGIKG